jgi:hypothetical protein
LSFISLATSDPSNAILHSVGDPSGEHTADEDTNLSVASSESWLVFSTREEGCSDSF